ncbi:MAG: hypothetical protein ABIR70_20460 [Bryobacteraceae bacterium]
MRTHALAITFLTAALVVPVEAQPPAYYARTIAGSSSIGDGGPARAARVFLPTDVTSDAAGNYYIAESIGRIRKVAADGTITSIALRIDGIASGDNGPAVDAGITSIAGITVSGNFLYFSQRVPCNIRRVNLTTGIVSNFAGNGTCSDGADGTATATSLNFPGALAADTQGRIYLTESTRVRRIDPATGRIDNVVGTGTAGFSGDGSPVVAGAQVNSPLGLAIDTNGVLYISDTGNCRIRRVALNTLITTVAGSLNCGSLGDGGTAIQAQLSGNGDIELDRTGTQLYIASSAPTIRRLQLDTGIIDRYAGTGVQGVIQENIAPLFADLRVVTGVHVDASGNVSFADYGANRIGRTGSNGFLMTLAGTAMFAGDGGPAQYGFLTQPVDVIVETTGRLLISENINRVIRRFSSPGTLTTIAGSGAPGGASGNGGAALSASLSPVALARDASGDIYTTDALSNTVRRIGANGAISQVGPIFASTLGGVAVDPAERYVYVSLTSLHRIVRISLATDQVFPYAGSGAVSAAASPGFSGDGGLPTDAKLNSPQRLFVDSDGNLFVADSANHRIRRINAAGDQIDTVAGNGLSDFSGDGSLATQASLPNPIGVAVDSSGNILVSNASAIFRIEKFTSKMYRIAGGTVRGNTSSLGVPALQARFNGISNVTVDDRGVIYFAETANLRVVALTASTYLTPTISGVISPGTFGAGTKLSPGGWMEIYGEKLADTTQVWKVGDFVGNITPSSLAGISVKIGGVDAYMQSVSPTQVNAVVPDGISGNVTIEVINNRGLHNVITSEPIVMTVTPRAPYLLAPPAFSRNGKQYVTAIVPGGAFAGPQGLIPGANFRPARSGDRVVVYGIGFGPTNPFIGAGYIANGVNALPDVKIRIAGIEAPVDYAGLASGYVGLYQFNFQVPSAPSGDAKFEITVEGQPLTQTLYLSIE